MNWMQLKGWETEGQGHAAAPFLLSTVPGHF